ncbi:MAG: hypothetical protein FGM32_11400 [Candidatus Kapabacteria bacterium]|nr:hypothetical protein [Candidatus Kapabacteria bacterium]
MKVIFKSKDYQVLEMIGFISFMMIILTQRAIRPNSQGFDESIKHLLGVVPNLLAGLAMSLAIFIYGKSYFDRFKLSAEKAMLASLAISIAGLTLWEYIQTAAHKSFDSEDVLASILGSLLSALAIYLNIRYNRKHASLK